MEQIIKRVKESTMAKSPMLRKWGTKYAAMLQIEKFQSSQQFGDGYTTSAIIKKRLG